MAKASYKQGAFSATDAVHQLQVASTKCDFKWMKAHAASARFFGAREAEIKKALSRCPSKRAGMMGPPLGMTKREAQQLLTGSFSLQEKQEILAAYGREFGWSAGRRAGHARPHPYAEADRYAVEDAWDQLLASARAFQRERKRSGGVRGTPTQHAAQSNKHLEAAREELEWLRYGKPKSDPKTRQKLVRKIRRHIDQGASECSWTRGEMKARCEDEVRRLDAELAREGMGAVRSRGVARGGCVYVVEAGRKRKVTSDLASAKSAGKRMAKKGSAKITKACSRGRGSDSGTVVARCTSRGCS